MSNLRYSLLLTILWSLTCSSLCAQLVYNNFKQDTTFWNRYTRAVPVEQQNQAISQLKNDSARSIQILHLNSDTLPDAVVFYNQALRVFVNSSKGFKSLTSDKGYFNNIQQDRLFNITTFHFVNPDCCNNGYSYYQQWLVFSDSTGVNLRKLEKIYFLPDGEIPDYLKMNLKIQLVKRSILQDRPGTRQSGAKYLSEYLESSRGSAISTKEDAEGNIWYYVVMEPKSSKATGSETGDSWRRMGWLRKDTLQPVMH